MPRRTATKPASARQAELKLGRVRCSAAVARQVSKAELRRVLDRHRRGETDGPLTQKDLLGRLLAILDGHSVLSRFELDRGVWLQVETADDRSVTTVELMGRDRREAG